MAAKGGGAGGTGTEDEPSSNSHVSEAYRKMRNAVERHPEMVGRVNGVFEIVIKGDARWFVDLKHAPGKVALGSARKSDVEITYDGVKTFVAVHEGRMSPQKALILQRMRLRGDISLLQKLFGAIERADKADKAAERKRIAEEQRRRTAEERAARAPEYARTSSTSTASTPKREDTDDLLERWSSSGVKVRAVAGTHPVSSHPSSAVPARPMTIGPKGLESDRLVDWLPDNAATHCMHCGVRFGFIERKHHCRSCGRIFCHSCSPQRPSMEGKRVCLDCFSRRKRPAHHSHHGHGHSHGHGHGHHHHPGLKSEVSQILETSFLGPEGDGGSRMRFSFSEAALARRGKLPLPDPPATDDAAAPRGGAVAAAPGGASAATAPTASTDLSVSVNPAPTAPSSVVSEVSDADSDGESHPGDDDGVASARVDVLETQVRLLRSMVDRMAGSEGSVPGPTNAVRSASLGTDAFVLALSWALQSLGPLLVPSLLLLASVLLGALGFGLLSWLCVALLAASLWVEFGADEAARVMRRRLHIFAAALAILADYKVVQGMAEALDERDQGALYEAAHVRNAARSYRVIRDLRGLWVKLGQYLSTRADAMPESYVAVLSRLQDSMPARPLAEVRATIEEELGQPVDKVFASIDEEALAAASIAQVHRGTLLDGTVVAVKVQHRGMESVLHSDLANLAAILRLVSMVEPGFDLRQVVEEWSSEVARELDFTHEARNMSQVRDNMRAAGLPVTVPRLMPGLVSRRVLVMRFMDGVKVSAPIQELDALGVDREKMVAEITRAYAWQIYVDGVFNGDPHPGNMMVVQRKTLRDGDKGDPDVALLESAPEAPNVLRGDGDEWVPVLLDFGLTKRLPDRVRIAFAKMVVAAEEIDYSAVLEAFDEMGMRFSSESIAEDMENLQHMFRDAVPADEARTKHQERAKQKAEQEKKQKEEGGQGEGGKRRVEAWPSEIMFFSRASELLQGLCSQLGTRHPFMRTMAGAARRGLLERAPSKGRFAPASPVAPDSRPEDRPVRGGSDGSDPARALLAWSAHWSPHLLHVATPTPHPMGAPRGLSPTTLSNRIAAVCRLLGRVGALEGAQVAVFAKGVCVADVAVGPAGPLDSRPINGSTLFPLLGASRAVLAALIAALVDVGGSGVPAEARGGVNLANVPALRLSPGTRVSAVWPSFGRGGKDRCHVSELLRCVSGVEGCLPADVSTNTFGRGAAWDKAADAVAAAEPLLLPCTMQPPQGPRAAARDRLDTVEEEETAEETAEE